MILPWRKDYAALHASCLANQPDRTESSSKENQRRARLREQDSRELRKKLI